MKLGPLAYSLLANAILLLALILAGWQLAQAKPECAAKTATSTVRANDAQAVATGKRDTALDKATTTTQAQTRADVRAAEDATNARDEATAAVPVSGACAMPAGLPSLDPAVDEANAAAGD